jgi:hypothetical protein
MSSLEPEDPSCMNTADEISCAAMTELAKKEARADAKICGYSILHPVCNRLNSLADRGTEYMLQANGIVSRNICFNPNVMIKTGEWEQQFETLHTNMPLIYDNLTRPR